MIGAVAVVFGAAPLALIVSVITDRDAQLVAVPVPGGGAPQTLASSPDGQLRFIDAFGPVAPFTRRRPPSLRNRVGLD